MVPKQWIPIYDESATWTNQINAVRNGYFNVNLVLKLLMPMLSVLQLITIIFSLEKIVNDYRKITIIALKKVNNRKIQ